MIAKACFPALARADAGNCKFETLGSGKGVDRIGVNATKGIPLKKMTKWNFQSIHLRPVMIRNRAGSTS